MLKSNEKGMSITHFGENSKSYGLFPEFIIDS